MIGVLEDVTDRTLAATALRESEGRQRLMLELVPALLWSASPDGREISLNERWLAFTGQTAGEADNFGWLAAIHPDDLPGTQAAFAHAFATGEPIERQHRIHKVDNGYRWHLVRHVPVRDAAGAIVRWFGAAIDVDDLHQLQQRQHLLLAELQHRVRNSLAVVRSIARRTARNSESVEEMEAHLEGRIDAFARVQAAVTRNPDGLIDLTLLIEEELLAYIMREGKGVSLQGPDLLLTPKTAETLSLAVHELATNAVKHGALSNGGKLKVRWALDGEDAALFTFRWEESGMDLPSNKPGRHGFGLELLERALPYELDAETKVAFRSEGLCFDLAMPAAGHVTSKPAK